MVNEDFERIKVIGKGSYGEVWLAKHKKDKKQYVLKKMNLGKASRKERKSAEQEAKLLSKLKHPNIVSYKDSFETENGFLFIAMQYCEGGDLYARLKEQRGNPLEERQVVEWFVQIAMALQYMHERNILHRDLKTQNIFLTKSKIIKVGDLGIARVLDNASDMATTLIGTPYYMSPELFSNKPYNHKSDVWALGCCVYEMTTLKHAFNAKDMNSLVYKILKGRMPPMPQKYSTDLLTLMRSMLHQDPEKRPSVNRILRDPYIKKNIAIFLEDTKKNNRRPSTAGTAARQSSALSQRRDSASAQQKPQLLPPSSSSSSSSQAAAAAERSPLPPKPIKRSVVAREAQERKFEVDEIDTKYSSAQPNKVSNIAPSASKAVEPVPQNLNPIKEKIDEPKSSSSENGDNDTVAPQTVKTAPQKLIAPKKKSYLRRKTEESESQMKDSGRGTQEENQNRPSTSGGRGTDQKKSSSKEFKNRPLPVPKAEESSGLPLKREDRNSDEKQQQTSTDSSKSSSVSSSKEDNGIGGDGDTPRSLINVSARERRRRSNPASGSYDNPQSARVVLRKVPERSESEKISKSEKARMPVRSSKLARGKARQPSLNDSSSSSDETKYAPEQKPGDTKEKELKRENKEMNNFISLLDTTLHMNKSADVSDDAEELIPIDETPKNTKPKPSDLIPPQCVKKEPSKDPTIHKSVSMPSVETLTNASRLMERIKMLHKDCIQGVGVALLHKAYKILDRIDEDEVEPKLVELLGKEKFDEYAGKIWQLKFCEEALFMAD